MIRRLFTAVSAMSLLLCVAITVLWVRSNSTGDLICWHHLVQAPIRGHGDPDYYRDISVLTGRGGVQIQLQDVDPDLDHVRTVFHVRARSHQDARSDEGTLGFAYVTDEADATFVYFPIWSVVLASAALPAIWLVCRFRLSVRSADGYCRSCGYDLRASRGSCPECGLPITARA